MGHDILGLGLDTAHRSVPPGQVRNRHKAREMLAKRPRRRIIARDPVQRARRNACLFDHLAPCGVLGRLAGIDPPRRRLKGLVSTHVALTGSEWGRKVLDSWDLMLPHWVYIVPKSMAASNEISQQDVPLRLVKA